MTNDDKPAKSPRSSAGQGQANRSEATETTGSWSSDEIDADFALMAEDLDYLAEANRICEEFAIADWEAFKLAETKTRHSQRTANG